MWMCTSPPLRKPVAAKWYCQHRCCLLTKNECKSLFSQHYFWSCILMCV
jgi:hypothetical protein